jgi:hypothetical protein
MKFVSRMKQSTIDAFSSIADRIFSFFGGRNLSVFKFWWLQLLLSLSLSLSHMTPSSDYETICHSLGRTKSLLENINSEISGMCCHKFAGVLLTNSFKTSSPFGNTSRAFSTTLLLRDTNH